MKSLFFEEIKALFSHGECYASTRRQTFVDFNRVKWDNISIFQGCKGKAAKTVVFVAFLLKTGKTFK